MTKRTKYCFITGPITFLYCKLHLLTIGKHLQSAFIHPCLNIVEISSGNPSGGMDSDPVINWIRFSISGSASSKQEYWLPTKFLNSCQPKLTRSTSKLIKLNLIKPQFFDFWYKEHRISGYYTFNKFIGQVNIMKCSQN